MNIKDLFGTFAPQSTVQPDPLFNRREAGWNAAGGALQGLGIGLMTGDWAKAMDVNNSAVDQYRQRKMQKYTAQQLMEEAAAKKAEREQAQAEIQRKNEWLKGISDPKMRATLEANPGLIDNYILATDPTFQTPEKPTFMEVNGKIINPMTKEVIYDGGTATDSNSITAQIAERQAAAEAMGLTPDDPAFRAYVLTGKMPREDQAPLTAGDKQAIREADDAVLAASTAIEQLQSVISGGKGKSLNDRAGSGALAGWQSWAARNDPLEWISSGNVKMFDDNKGEATTSFNNVIMNQALGSLKSIFGGNPTEGERAILLELQASVDKTPTEREDIIKRAIRLAEKRLQFNKDRADELRGQTYYKPNGGSRTVIDGVTIEEVGQ